MSATVNGKSFTANTISDNTSLFANDTILYINGVDTASGDMVILQILSYRRQTGTFTIADSNSTGYATFTHGSTSYYSRATTGQIVLTELSPNIKGTFHFTTADSTVVTNGTFIADGGL